MRVLLVSANTETLNMPSLPVGLGCVAAAAEQDGHEVAFLDLMGREDGPQAAAAAVAAASPGLVGISVRNIDDQNRHRPRFLLEQARPVIAACKAAADVPVVLGGAGYSMFPVAALDYLGADMGICGEGETAFRRLLACLEAGTDPAGVPGLFSRGRPARTPRCFETDLDRLPLPGPRLFEGARTGDPACFLPFQTRRGCPLGCSYCSTASIEGRRIRRRSPEAVVAALRRWREAGFRRVFFVDNTFNLPPGYARTLCERMAAEDLDIDWRCILYPGQVDAGLVAAMARAGCREVSLGFESGAPAILSALNKRFGCDDIRRAARLLAEAGIRRMGFLMFGSPGETPATVTESLAFADALALEAMRLTVGVRIYPGTRLARQAVSEGRIAAADDLLRPRFYLASGLEPWLSDTVAAWASERPHWVV